MSWRFSLGPPKFLSFTSYILLMAQKLNPEPFEIERDGVTIAGETSGEGPDVVLLHGLTATRRYVVMGSNALPRAGYRVTSFDARGHGESSAARSASEYEYRDMVDDLAAVLDHVGADRAALAGGSMGAATAMAFALAWPERVSALVQITPAYDGLARSDPEDLAAWDRLADGLDRDGVEGFVEAWDPHVEDRWRETVLTVTRQRLSRHRDLNAVADAIRVVSRSLAFEGLEELEAVEVPTLIVASRDDADPGHPYAVGERYAERLPRAKLVSEEEGQSPLAWQGSRLSKAIAEFLGEAGWASR
jgi:pimeloyl-ACP methyl ester carboxylesterase